ncbi:hypothetical protein D3C72_1772430 [compost metagenome]
MRETGGVMGEVDALDYGHVAEKAMVAIDEQSKSRIQTIEHWRELPEVLDCGHDEDQRHALAVEEAEKRFEGVGGEDCPDRHADADAPDYIGEHD